ncbi:MAG: MATE family efflux transporter [Acidobacteria bacterium]|nr:MATE family efflux transporter [Acidobacteriota bacterium]
MHTAQLPLRRRFFRLAVPNIISNVTVPLVGLVDTAMLGHLPDISFLAGVALGAVIFDYAYWSFGFLRMGTTGVTAQAVGRDDTSEIWQILYRALVLALLIAAVLLLAQRLIAALGFAVLAGHGAVEAAGRDYFFARIWGAPATLSNYVLLGWFLGRERAREALLMTLVGNLANVGLDYLFIMRLGMAAGGAGLATALSQYLMLATAVVLVLRAGHVVAPVREQVLDRARIVGLVRLNRDILVRTMVLMTTFAISTNFSALLGTGILAANTILFRLQMVASYLIDGAAFATESLAGIYKGSGDTKGLRHLLRLAMFTGVAFAVPVLGAMFLIPGPLYGLMTSHQDVAGIAWRYSGWMIPVLLFGAVAFIYDGLFIGLTEGKVLRDQMMISAIVCYLPLALLALWQRNNDLLWAAMALFMVGRCLTLWLAQRRVLAAMERVA